MAPTPKAPGQRRRRNLGQAQWRQLPAAGSGLEAPGLPERDGGWMRSTVEWWLRAWSSPMAVAWLESDLDSLLRLAEMRDAVARDPKLTALQGQVTALEDRLGLSPKARRQLQWEIVQAESGGQRAGLPQPRKLRAVG